MKSKWIKGLTSVLSIGLVAVIVSTVIIRGTLEAEAADTLLGIQTLINEVRENEEEYIILELVPDKNTARIGTYISGYEPVLTVWDEELEEWKSWQQGLFSCVPADGQTDPAAARAEYVKELKEKLEAYLNDFEGNNLPVAYSEYSESEGPAEGYTKLDAPAVERKGYFIKGTTGERFEPVFVFDRIKGDNFESQEETAYYTADAKELEIQVSENPDTGEITFHFLLDGVELDINQTACSLYRYVDGRLVYQCSAGDLPDQLGDSVLDLLPEEESTETAEEETEEETVPESTEASSEESVEETENESTEGAENGTGGESADGSEENPEEESTETPGDVSGNSTAKRGEQHSRTVTVTLPQLLSGNTSPTGSTVTSNDAPAEVSGADNVQTPETNGSDQTKEEDSTFSVTGYYTVAFTYMGSPADVTADTPLYRVDNTESIQTQENGSYVFHEAAENESGGIYRFGEASIYYKGGFDNQEWFKKHVLNMDEEDYESFPIRVITMTPEELNRAEGLPDFDFLYINDGTKAQTPDPVRQYGADNDLSDVMAGALFNDVVVSQKPCMLDGAVLFVENGDAPGINASLEGTQIFKLCAMFCQESPSQYASNFNALSKEAMLAGMKADADKNFVTEQTYCVFDKTSIFNGDFYKAVIYQGNAEEVSEGFQDVRNEIEVENLYREADASSDLRLPTDISQAVVVRHIMNYRHKRSGVTKESIRVLEIQPARTDTRGLSKETLKEWAPGLQDDKIFITTMTTAEFIGKVETLNDKYDLIYIGTSKEHLNVVSGTGRGVGSTVYNDHTMDGLIYCHTGDMRYSAIELSGMLNTDYVGGDPANALYYYTSVRYGGNDITKEKMEALNSFLAGSYPVIVSDEFFQSPAVVYQNIYYGGYSVNLGVGTYTLSQMEALGIANDDITSVKVKPGYKVTFYEDDNFGGAVKEVTGELAYLGDDWNDRPSSMKIELIEGAQPQRVINQDHIDNSSFMYQFVRGAMDKTNFYAESDMDGDNRLFQFYLNRPKASLTGTSANGTLKDNGIYYIYPGAGGRYTLEYHFTIVNEGTASVDTQYQCRFYVDVNADGKFSSREESTDILLTSGGNVVAGDQLYAGREYVLIRNVPDGYKGVLPWKIEVSQVNNPNIYCYMDGYTKLQGLEKETIKVLQICRDQVGWPDWWGGYGEKLFSLAEQINGKKTVFDNPIGDRGGTLGHSSDVELVENYQNNLYYVLVHGGYYGGVYYEGIADDFEIDVDFMTISKFEEEYRNINMNRYNMLILGFSDAYGDFSGSDTEGPMSEIVKFIKSGKSVLFAHDTTSYFNYPKDRNNTGILNRFTGQAETSNQHHNASTLNRYIRSLVGMDRNGVMSMAALRSGQAISAGTGEWNSLTAMGKEIPYQPKSDCTRTVPQTQGYTYSIINAKVNHSAANVPITEYGQEATGLEYLWRNEYLNIRYDTVYYHDQGDPNGVGYHDNGQIPLNYNGEVTNLLVTQVNEGQITEYPYRLQDEFQVTTTHGQYYQLDFTADDDRDGQSDLVVWYCLGGRRDGSGNYQDTIYSMSPNDVSNNYYIYNKGNITYTGMGHAAGDAPYAVEEAKLFINTMIASYSAGIKNPSITILENGSRDAAPIDVTYRYQDEENNLTYEKYEGDYEKVYFTVEDVNFVNGTRRIAVNAYYEADDGNITINIRGEDKRLTALAPEIYNAADNVKADAGNLASGGVYYILIPKELIREDLTHAGRFQLYLEAQSIIESYGNRQETGKAYSGLEFIKAYLFDIT